MEQDQIILQAIKFGGSANPPVYAITESWNGASWTEVADMSNARDGFAGSYTQLQMRLQLEEIHQEIL